MLEGRRQRLRAVRLLGTMPFRVDPWRATGATSITVLSQLTGVATAVLLRDLTDQVVKGDNTARITVGWLVGVVVVTLASAWASFTIRIRLGERVTAELDADLARTAALIHTVEHFERPEYLDRVEQLRTQHQALAGVHDAAVWTAASTLRLGASLALLSTIHPLLLTLPLFAIPSLLAGHRAQRLYDEGQEAAMPSWRLHGRLFQIAGAPDAGKELRVFGLGDELLRRFHRLVDASDVLIDRALWRGVMFNAVGWLIFATGFIGGIVVVAGEVLAGRASPGQFVLALTLAGQISAQISLLVTMTSWFQGGLLTAGRYVWLRDYAEDRASEGVGDGSTVPERLTKGIQFSGVGFAYPATDGEVLHDVDLLLPAGSTVAVVGENGAGKTTLGKLLLRMYDPTAGSIQVDGVDLRSLPVDEWRKRTAAGFQDFARFQLLAREVVGIGDIGCMDDPLAVDRALERGVATAVVASLPRGLDTQLGRSFEGGFEVSGGEWQKLAIGRAMMREAPLLLVLDEPTAALDPQAEHDLFDRYAGAARRAATETGAITILVSHRFSTVRMADLIVVIHQGRLVECGTHEELMTLAGRYAELYSIQAAAYA